MKNTIYISLAFLMSVIICGCSTAPEVIDTPASPKLLLDKASEIKSAGGIAVVGIARSALLSSALDKSLANAQTRLMSFLESELEDLKESLKSEVGEDSIDQFNELFYAASDNLVKKQLQEIIPADIKYETDNGVTTAYSLLLLDPNSIIEAFPSDSKQLNHIFTRFRASKAFAQLQRKIKQYEIWKQDSERNPTD